MTSKTTPPLTLTQAYERLCRYCDKAERCQQDVIRKAIQWRFSAQEANELSAQLITSGYLSEQRYASAFAHDKFAFNRWGAHKIELELKRKGISDRNVREAIAQIPKEDEAATILTLIQKKEPQLKGLQLYQKKIKLMRYLLSKGFAGDAITKQIEIFIHC